MLRVLHFNNSPGVETTTDLLPLHLNQLVGTNHSKGNARLGEEDKCQRIPREKQSQKKGLENKCIRENGGEIKHNNDEQEENGIYIPSGLWSAP